MRKRSWWESPPMYMPTRNGQWISIPYEKLHPIDPNSPIHTFDFAGLETRLMNYVNFSTRKCP